MEFLNKQIEALVKKQNPSLLRKQISCGIFQESDTSDTIDTTTINASGKTH